MNKQFKDYNQNQQYLMPISLQDWLPKDHLVYFISEIVEEMNLSGIYKDYTEERGQPPYSPLMMTKVWIYAFSQGVRSSRKVEKALHEDIGFKIISGNQTPDYWTLNAFRTRHHKALGNLFYESVQLGKKCGLVKMGHVSVDGTKVKANASRHSAMSYKRMIEEEKRLKDEIGKYFKEAAEIDEEENKKYGNKKVNELPKDLQIREKRLKAIKEARAELEKEAIEKAKKEQAERRKEAEKEDRDFKPKNDPKDAKPKDKAQKNFTDSESKIMMNSEKAFIQGYNCQAAVDAETQYILAAHVTDVAADPKSLIPLLKETVENTGKKPGELSGDRGYYSENNIKELKNYGIEAFIPPDKIKHSEWRNMKAPVGRIPKNITPKDLMRRKLRTKRGKEKYKLRMTSIEPVFGQIKEVRGLRQFLHRGKEKINSLWRFDCTVHNLLKLFTAKMNLQFAM
jgi:transposase